MSAQAYAKPHHSTPRTAESPPCGRLIEYREPHSPFQKLIDAARRRYGYSGRDLAEKVGVSQSTLWIWLHNLNGFPHPKSFNAEHVRALSKILKIPQARIRSAVDASRHLFTPTEKPEPEESIDTMHRFIEILENDKRKTVSKAYVLHLRRISVAAARQRSSHSPRFSWRHWFGPTTW